MRSPRLRMLHRLSAAGLLAALLLAAGPAPAEEEEAPPVTAVPAPPVPPAPELEGPRATPRRAMLGFLEAARDGDWARAAGFLDLRRAGRAASGPRLARHLKVVLDRELWVDWSSLSDDVAGAKGDTLPASQDYVGTVESRRGPVRVLLERVAGDGGRREWKVAPATVAAVPDLYDEFGYGPIGEVLPPVFLDLQILEVQLWQWTALIALVVAAWLLSWLLTSPLIRALGRLVQRSQTTLDDRVLAASSRPLRFLVATGMIVAGSRLLGLAIPAQNFVDQLGRAATIVGLAWLLLRLVEEVSQSIERELHRKGQSGTAAVVPLGQRGAKVVVVAFAVLAALQTFGFNVTGVLAGLGVGGLAVALAAQKTLENLFGGLTLIADQPVRVGDFCRFGDQVGTVEEIGLRSTRVRTLDRTVVSVPNAEFSAMQLENYARRDRIWLKTTLGVRYETTPDQLRYLLVELKKMLVAHPSVDPDPARVRFAAFGAYSLDIEIFAYVRTSDINEFLAVREDIFLRIMDIVADSGTGFAFPSQTLYAAKDEGLDRERSEQAAARLGAWRDDEAMPLPWLPDADQKELAGTLDYPPRGSAPRDAQGGAGRLGRQSGE